MPTPPTPPPRDSKQPLLRFDWEEWLPYLEECEASLDEKRQLIETLGSIVIAFVDHGWDVRPHLAQETSGQVIDLADVLRRAVLNSEVDTKEGA